MATVICRNDISPFRLGVAGVYYAKPSENIDCSKQKFGRKICAFCWIDFLSNPTKPEKDSDFCRQKQKLEGRSFHSICLMLASIKKFGLGFIFFLQTA